MRPEPKFKIGDILIPTSDHFGDMEPFEVVQILWNEDIGENFPCKWIYQPKGVDIEYDIYGCWWEGYVKLHKRRVVMEENE